MCGIFGITGSKDASRIAYVGLFTLQHRGQESAGLVTDDHGKLLHYTGMGLVSEVFTNEVLATLEGRNAIGHIRYSTAGSSHIKNAQPLVLNSCLGTVAVALVYATARVWFGRRAALAAAVLAAATGLFTFFEVLVLRLRDELGQTAESMRARHTNME